MKNLAASVSYLFGLSLWLLDVAALAISGRCGKCGARGERRRSTCEVCGRDKAAR